MDRGSRALVTGVFLLRRYTRNYREPMWLQIAGRRWDWVRHGLGYPCTPMAYPLAANRHEPTGPVVSGGPCWLGTLILTREMLAELGAGWRVVFGFGDWPKCLNSTVAIFIYILQREYESKYWYCSI